MFNRIVVASTLSKSTFDMIECLTRLKEFGTEECLLLQCLDSKESDESISSFAREIYKENLSRQQEMLQKQGFKVEARIIAGEFAQEINRIARTESFSLIVIGPNEFALTENLFAGGSSLEVVRNAITPVLLINTSLGSLETLDSVRACSIKEHILFPTDFSDNASFAFETVKSLVALGVKKVTLAHVQEELHMLPQSIGRMRKYSDTDWKMLLKLAEELRSISSVEVSTELLHGSPAPELISLIRKSQIPLVVMGSQGRGYVRELLLGSVSHNLVRNSEASVLLIPAKR